MTSIEFTSSDTFVENGGTEYASVEVEGYVEATYESLKTGPDGQEVAAFICGAWQLNDGRRFSDWAVFVKEGA